MMQSPKYQLPRKPRKLLSRDKKELGVSSRQKSRDSEDKKLAYQNSPNKPHQLISNLRFELTNLRHEVAKLSKKQHKRSHNNQIKLEYESRSPKQPKNIHSYYFEDAKNTLPDEQKTQRTNISCQSEQLRFKSQERYDEVHKLKQQIIAIQVKNKELVKANEELNNRMNQLGDRLRREYEIKIHQLENQKQRNSRQKQTEENDRTVNYQRQVLANKNLIEELKQQVASFSKQNGSLKASLQEYKIQVASLTEKDLIIHEKESCIEKLSISLKTLELSLKDFQAECDRLKLVQVQNKKMAQEAQLKTKELEDLKCKLQSVTKRSNELQKKMVKLSQKYDAQVDNRRKSKPMRFQGQDVKQLQQIILLHQKSLTNQQSDINYLESEVRKLSFYKHLAKNQAFLLETLNEQIVELQVSNLNRKYNNQ